MSSVDGGKEKEKSEAPKKIKRQNGARDLGKDAPVIVKSIRDIEQLKDALKNVLDCNQDLKDSDEVKQEVLNYFDKTLDRLYDQEDEAMIVEEISMLWSLVNNFNTQIVDLKSEEEQQQQQHGGNATSDDASAATSAEHSVVNATSDDNGNVNGSGNASADASGNATPVVVDTSSTWKDYAPFLVTTGAGLVAGGVLGKAAVFAAVTVGLTLSGPVGWAIIGAAALVTAVAFASMYVLGSEIYATCKNGSSSLTVLDRLFTSSKIPVTETSKRPGSNLLLWIVKSHLTLA